MAIASKNKPEIKPKSKGISAETKKNIDAHKKAATHHEAAARFHLEAAKHHEAGNTEKAHQSSVKASGHSFEANDLHREVTKSHALAK